MESSLFPIKNQRCSENAKHLEKETLEEKVLKIFTEFFREDRINLKVLNQSLQK